MFTEKVLEQKDNIDQIQSHAVATTENVRDGNEELRKAIQRNASIRVYILFFLIVMSFSLLFLDWYNDWEQHGPRHIQSDAFHIKGYFRGPSMGYSLSVWINVKRMASQANVDLDG